ncbi:hypothetical protein [Streptomyces hydrogenans]|uniref:hypothetical protein n=1 Tax=Streptomyces hydrogenans TaxID=1873719 RepID=UPI00381CA9A8
MDLVFDPFFPDLALTLYVKVKALGVRVEGCTASVGRLAEYIGMSPRSVHRGMAALTSTEGGRTPHIDTRRRTKSGGTGQTALRTLSARREPRRYVFIPVAAAEALTPRRLRAYAALAWAEFNGSEITVEQLAGVLRHESGKHAGEPVHERTARTILDDLAATNWIGLDRRAGTRGRHRITVHDSPLHLAPTPMAKAPVDFVDEAVDSPVDEATGTSSSPENGGTSGPEAGGTSLASKEDLYLSADRDLSQPSVEYLREVRASRARTEGDRTPETDDSNRAPAPVRLLRRTPGVDLLVSIGAASPRYRLTGKCLADQALMVDGLLASGWTPADLRQVIAGRPLPSPEEITRSVAAIISNRLRQAVMAPPPSSVTPLDDPDTAGWDRHDQLWTDRPQRSTTAAADRPVAEAVTRRITAECEGLDGTCGRPVIPGHDICRTCAEATETTEEREARETCARLAARWEVELTAAAGAGADEPSRFTVYLDPGPGRWDASDAESLIGPITDPTRPDDLDGAA